MKIYFFFFFQAEDGIRDDLVTGVQTCALPISDDVGRSPREPRERLRAAGGRDGRRGGRRARRRRRSEERRVGKECRSRWSPYHSKKKQYPHTEEKSKATAHTSMKHC